MNDFPGFNLVVTRHTDNEIERYEHDCTIQCGMLILIAALVLLLESNIKYFILIALLGVYLFKKLSF